MTTTALACLLWSLPVGPGALACLRADEAASRPAGSHAEAMARALPPRSAALVRLLDSPSYVERKFAEARILGARDLRAAAWAGMDDAPPATRDAAARMDAFLERCRRCAGSGVCPNSGQSLFCDPCRSWHFHGTDRCRACRPAADVDIEFP